ncbi:MAG TPA: membrane protein insertase YidC [Patescibacteria group bacterium]|nr:membrane protein insertase YidC [Patescibacteria group bacterium]
MDRQSFIGFALIALIVMGWMFYNQSTQTQQAEKKKAVTAQVQPNSETAATPVTPQADLGATFTPLAASSERTVTIETDLYKAAISSKGGTVVRWELKKFEDHRGNPVQLIRNGASEFSMSFISSEGRKIDARQLNFELSTAGHVKVSGSNSFTLTARLGVSGNSAIERTYTFYGNRYDVGTKVNLVNMESVIPSRRFDISWNNGLKYQEENSVDESNSSIALASLNGSMEELDAAEFNIPVEAKATGTIEYIGVRSKYFLAAIKQNNPSSESQVFLNGVRNGAANEGMVETYSASYRLPYRGGTETKDFTLYIGPLDYNIVNELGMGGAVDFGWAIIRPIGQYLLLPLLKAVYSFVGNYGIAIIVFSIIIKLLLYPLSISQTRMAAKQQLLAPVMAEMREKYKDDPMEQQKQTMKIYQEYGINPAGGCLPLLLQMPILYALWAVLSHAVELRGVPFVGWINDLSRPDVIANLPFKIVVGSISGLALLMGITMFIQQKMTITDPRQKAMIYMMPVMFTLMFSGFPAGLNLYYLTFNLIGIFQQVWITKFSKNKMTLADLKKMPKKEGWLQKKMREAQQMAEAQGRTLPGQPPRNGTAGRKPQNQPGKRK